jgi:hypothetical protein
LLKKGEEALLKRQLEEERLRGNFVPQITPMAKNLERKGDVFER